MTKGHKKLEFSKALAIVVTVLFIVSVVFVFAVWFFQDRVGTEILGYVATPFGVVITGYFTKAGFENYKKIRLNEDGEGIGQD